MEALKTELKNHIIEQMNLEDVKIEEIVDTEPLFGEGLGLDSIDALELIVMLETHYGIKIANPEEGKQIFESINSLAEYVEANKK